MNIYIATEIESEQGDGYEDYALIVARNEDTAFKRFTKFFNRYFYTYLYYWHGEADEDFIKRKYGCQKKEWLKDKKAGVYF